jgi:anti-sigma28 factor (negative regulator of flagellin synthesis)
MNDQMVSSTQDPRIPQHPAISDVREAKVAALRRAIATGAYRIPTDKLAEKCMETMICGS